MPWSAQVDISAPKTKTGNKPKTTAQTTKAETIKMSCLHKAQRPIGYLEEYIVFPIPFAAIPSRAGLECC
jgi:hypothetical protein